MIPLEQCKHRGLYYIHSRNLSFGVFDKNQSGFVGIRTKFSSRYLFCEYHFDIGATHGTVNPIEFLEDLPAEIELSEILGIIDPDTKREVVFDKPLADGGKGWYYVDTKSAFNGTPTSVSNTKLFDWLDTKGEEYADRITD